MHYAFDAWMAREFPSVPFERYADDAVVHCKSERQARHVRQAIADRMAEVGLRLHPDKRRRSCTARTATAQAQTSGID
jgi:RNA-directed DNA polymerase